jgi:mannose-1-phosphate guanylyltransferase
MKIIIFAGGTGKRFWPASRKSAPKQFMGVVNDKPLLRERIDILLEKYKPEDLFVSSGVQYKNELYEMLSDLPKENIILEPEMRDNGAAVTLAVTYVNSKFPEEVICTQWSDHLIKNPEVFHQAIEKAALEAHKQHKVVFITSPARFPSPFRGYVHFKKENIETGSFGELKPFIGFVEKPSVEVAEKYIESGEYGWNPGYMAFPGKLLLDTVSIDHPAFTRITKAIVDSNFSEESLKQYSELEKIAIDYIFHEKLSAENGLVIYSDFGWSDIGEWMSLKEALEDHEEDLITKGLVKDLGSKDSLIYNYEDGKLVATIGLEGFIVVNTKDVVAIFPKKDNPKLKEFLKGLETEGLDGVL